MKTQAHQKLTFTKNAITELNNDSMSTIIGGTSDSITEVPTQIFEDFPISRFTSRLCNYTTG